MTIKQAILHRWLNQHQRRPQPKTNRPGLVTLTNLRSGAGPACGQPRPPGAVACVDGRWV
ncbi:hypothetical protein [Roseiflexus sp.]|uniref:hypothetical protein n=1 Tax=Roseiflexus sp. TaxID=2562120 RepID=UPI00398B2EB5